MKVPDKKDLANQLGPESCAESGNGLREALTGESAGVPLSCEIQDIRGADAVSRGGRQHRVERQREFDWGPAQSETHCTQEHSMHGTQESPQLPAADGAASRSGRPEAGRGGGARCPDATDAHGCGQSDDVVVPMKPANKGEAKAEPAERVEGRPSTKRNTTETTTPRTQDRIRVSQGLRGVRELAQRDRNVRFTSLLHHITPELLTKSFDKLKDKAAAGIDKVTKREYKRKLRENVQDLHRRIHTGAYRAQPSRRVYIEKEDGRKRPLGIASLEDKIAQHALATVLNHIYEADFCDFSYGFRPGRSQHDALDALWVDLMRKKVNWVLDADISGFFDTISHEWMLKFIEHRIADPRVLRLLVKWLTVGIEEDGKRTKATVGTPQGAVISPLLANVFLHYVLDLWADQWRNTKARGEVVIVRYADDFVLGFQHRDEAKRFLEELRERMQSFGLTLHPDKTRLIEFGRYAERDRRNRGVGSPETFKFLGFTHMCGKTRKRGKFIVNRKTLGKRLRAKLDEIRTELYMIRHRPIKEHGKWLRSVVNGYLNYHAIPGNWRSMAAFVRECARSWLHALRRRSQRSRMTWARFQNILDAWLPRLTIRHPYPTERLDAKTQGRSRMR